MTTLRELIERVHVEDRAADVALANGDANAWTCCCGHAQNARLAVADYLLTHPEAVEAYEAVVALGKARRAAAEAERAESASEEFNVDLLEAKVSTRAVRDEAMDTIEELADRLAAKGGE